MPTINAIPAVVAAAPGIAAYDDLPLTVPRGVVPSAAATMRTGTV
jgi:2,4-diaminopentanoate dehydrogenase